MTVPNFQAIMLPVLTLVADGAEYRHGDVVEKIADHFALGEDDRNELLPSGSQTRLANRVAWARSHMKAAGLIENLGGGRFRISAVGLEVLAEKPDALTVKLLERFPSYVEFRTPKVKTASDPAAQDEDQTPEELLENGYASIREALAGELLARIKTAPPSFFEQLVVDVLVAMGYGGSRRDAGEAVGQSGDGGIDGIIKEDKLGLDAIFLQAKRWEASVGRPVVQAFAGSLDGQRARKGVLITTSSFSAEAREYVSRIEKKIVLIDGAQLAQLMIDHDVGVNLVANYSLKRLDEEYFDVGTSVAPVTS